MWREGKKDGRDPDDATIRLDVSGRRFAGPPGGTAPPDGPGDADRSDGPVFVDASGRRSKTLRRVGWVLATACAAYAVTLVLAVLGGNSSAPWLPLADPEGKARAEQVEDADETGPADGPDGDTGPTPGPSGSPSAGGGGGAGASPSATSPPVPAGAADRSSASASPAPPGGTRNDGDGPTEPVPTAPTAEKPPVSVPPPSPDPEPSDATVPPAETPEPPVKEESAP